ncbi:hypothetical protein N836_23120 [Leptolyngbya sp. Heron Island J]|nr:hypothetical protein N836_23120 [Leptolyngbya sp. Heron Island J]
MNIYPALALTFIAAKADLYELNTSLLSSAGSYATHWQTKLPLSISVME